MMKTEKRQRPSRLRAETRELAERALAAEFGKGLPAQAVEMDDIPGFADLPRREQYTLCARRIAERAPIRLISPYFAGSAVFARAREHIVPATLGGQEIFASTSHLTPGFDRVLTLGWDGLRAEAEERLAASEGEEAEYCRSLLAALDSAMVFHARTLAHVRVHGDSALANVLSHVPMQPPRGFREALQSLWFMFAHLRLLGNWPAIGRLDQMLCPYYEKDAAAGILSRDEARELLAHFFIMGCEWITGEFLWGSGDAQHYQNIVLGGSDMQGNDLCNDVTMLILEVVEELPISDFPIAVRVTNRTPDSILRKLAEVTAFGGGVAAIYNDEVCVQSLVQAGIPEADARGFANDGCWEIQVPGRTNFSYSSLDILTVLNRDVLRVTGGEPAPEFNTVDEILTVFQNACEAAVDRALPDAYWRDHGDGVTPEIDLYTGGCVARARGYFQGGPDYVNQSFHAGGMADVANSLYAIDELCFKRKLVCFQDLIKILRADWAEQEALRQYARNKLVYFGNDNDAADAFFTRVFDIFVNAVNRQTQCGRVRISPGISTFGREIEWRGQRGATAFGAKAGDILATNTAPSPGTDTEGATALLRSTCKADYTRLSGSAATQLLLTPDMLAGEEGITVFTALLRGFISLGGFFLQTDVAEPGVYEKARENPDTYRNLSVRISGWSARFVTLDREWQDMIIARARKA